MIKKTSYKKKQIAKATSTSKTNEKLVLEKFKVEELEKRYEMGWVKLGNYSDPNGGAGVNILL
ncbi:hypothetical protein [Apibacter adventoris]|uniref:hypothetical protein n=1 Tax=Apibacter adventoris TaxID=1679466 RepID=UPI000CF63700|nr:hypothetical protein [Apibacter adventoris]PQL96048.1 hypothetical protein C4S76_00730 [Apibacter adventoris]